MAFGVVRPAAVLIAIAIVAGVRINGEASPRKHTPAPALQPRVGLDASSDAQARIMRRATRQRAAELTAAAGCGSAQFMRCTQPALRHAAMSGRTTTVLLNAVVAQVPAGRCRDYLFRLGAASTAAADQARWLLVNFETGPRHVAGQIALAAQMLDRAWRAASPDVCAPEAGGPAA